MQDGPRFILRCHATNEVVETSAKASSLFNGYALLPLRDLPVGAADPPEADFKGYVRRGAALRAARRDPMIAFWWSDRPDGCSHLVTDRHRSLRAPRLVLLVTEALSDDCPVPIYAVIPCIARRGNAAN